MINIGIISVHKTNNLLNFLRKNRFTFPEGFGDNIKFVPVEISLYKNNKKLSKLVKKAEKMLIDKDVSNIVLTCECKKMLGSDTLSGIPPKEIFNAFKLFSRKINKRYKEIVILDKNLSAFNTHSFEKIMFLTNNFYLCTNNTCYAHIVAEAIYNEFGVWINICEKNCANSSCVINVDKGKIHIGDIIVDGISYDVDFNGYDVDINDFIAISDISSYVKIDNLMSGKNLIKLVDN